MKINKKHLKIEVKPLMAYDVTCGYYVLLILDGKEYSLSPQEGEHHKWFDTQGEAEEVKSNLDRLLSRKEKRR